VTSTDTAATSFQASADLGRVTGSDALATEAARDSPTTALSATHRSSNARSLAVCQRRSGSFARQRLTMRSRAGGTVGTSDAIGAGSRSRIAPIKLTCDLLSNALRPVRIS
jgi:hypothetical protein